MVKVLAGFIATICMCGMASGADVVQMDYGYRSGIVTFPTQHRTYVICSDCPSERKVREQLRIPLAINTGSREVMQEHRPMETGHSEPVRIEEGGGCGRDKGIGGRCLPVAVLFDLNSSSLGNEGREVVSRTASCLKQTTPSVKVGVHGYTCDLGTMAVNQALAEKRAETVADALKKEGIESVEIEGKGKCCYVSQDRKMNRRAEVAPAEKKDEMTTEKDNEKGDSDVGSARRIRTFGGSEAVR